MQPHDAFILFLNSLTFNNNLMLLVYPIKTEKELNSDILNITMLIQEKYPELSKYIGEMPMTMSESTDPKEIITNLQNYYHSLNSLLTNYNTSHLGTAKA